jgi:hypothetical protein
MGFCSTFISPQGLDTQSAVQKSSQINIRFDPNTEAALNETAKELGLSKSALVRNLTEKFLAEVRRTGAVRLRPEWVNEMTKADARTQWGDRKITMNDRDDGDETISNEPREKIKYLPKKPTRKKRTQ